MSVWVHVCTYLWCSSTGIGLLTAIRNRESRMRYQGFSACKQTHCCRSIVLVFILSVCSEVFGIAEQRHTPCHLPTVSRAPQSFMSARLVMRADRKRWDSPISPPTHTEGDSLSGDKATGCTFLCQHACESESVCTHYAHYHTSTPQRHPLIILNFSWHFSYTSAEVAVSLSVFSHSALPPRSLSPPYSLYVHFFSLLYPHFYPSLTQNHLESN